LEEKQIGNSGFICKSSTLGEGRIKWGTSFKLQNKVAFAVGLSGREGVKRMQGVFQGVRDLEGGGGSGGVQRATRTTITRGMGKEGGGGEIVRKQRVGEKPSHRKEAER